MKLRGDRAETKNSLHALDVNSPEFLNVVDFFSAKFNLFQQGSVETINLSDKSIISLQRGHGIIENSLRVFV